VSHGGRDGGPVGVLHCIGSLNRGGAQRQLQLLLANIDAGRFASGVLFLEANVYGGDDDPAAFYPPGVDLLEVDRGGRWDLLGLRRRIARRVEEFRPDIVHTWLPEVVTIPAALAARRLGSRLISSQRRSISGLRDRVGYLPHYLADVVVSNFAVTKEPPTLRRLFASRRGRVIANAIDLERVMSIPEPPLPAERAGFLMMFIGRLAATKRADLAVRATVELRRRGVDAGLLICGGGSPRQEAELRALIERLGAGEWVHFLGFRSDWPGLARQVDLVVLPSVSEGMSNVLIEAAAVGAPIVAARVDGIREVFTHDEDAWLVEPGSLESLVEGLETLQRHPEQRARLAANAGRIVADFAVERMVREYEALYSGLTGGAADRHGSPGVGH